MIRGKARLTSAESGEARQFAIWGNEEPTPAFEPGSFSPTSNAREVSEYTVPVGIAERIVGNALSGWGGLLMMDVDDLPDRYGEEVHTVAVGTGTSSLITMGLGGLGGGGRGKPFSVIVRDSYPAAIEGTTDLVLAVLEGVGAPPDDVRAKPQSHESDLNLNDGDTLLPGEAEVSDPQQSADGESPADVVGRTSRLANQQRAIEIVRATAEEILERSDDPAERTLAATVVRGLDWLKEAIEEAQPSVTKVEQTKELLQGIGGALMVWYPRGHTLWDLGNTIRERIS